MSRKILADIQFIMNTSEEGVVSLFTGIANMSKGARPASLASLATVLNSRLKKVLVAENVSSMRSYVSNNELDTKSFEESLSICFKVVDVMSAARMGSINFPMYSTSLTGAGVRINKVGAKSGLNVVLTDTVSFEVDKSRFISEFLKWSEISISSYDMVMNRIVVLKDDKEVVISDFLLKLALIKDSGISLDSLVMNENYVLVLKLTEEGVLYPVQHPLTDSKILGLVNSIFGEGCSSYTAPSKALEGYVELGVDLKGLAKLGEDGNFHSFLDAKKLAARQEKLNGDTCIARIKTKVFIVTDSSAESLPYFNTGCFYASDRLLRSIGCARVTSDINNTLIKGATHYAPWILGSLGEEASIAASSSVKGGLIGLTANKGFEVDYENFEIPTLKEEKITLLNGDVVSGVYADVILKITNAYTAEMFQRFSEEVQVTSLEEAQAVSLGEKAERLLGFNKVKAKALSVEVMHSFRKFGTKSIVDTLGCMEEEKLISLKPAITTLTQGEFENIALSFGDDVAKEYMQSVIDNSFNKVVDNTTIAAKQWLDGCAKKSATDLSVTNILETFEKVFKEYGVKSEDKVVSSLNTQALRALVLELGFIQEGVNWVHIPEMGVYLPIGKVLYKDLLEEHNDVELVFEMPTALKYFVSTFNYLLQVSVAGNLSKNMLRSVGENLHYMIQDSLINKRVSKLKVHGKYMTLLPGFWLENEHDVCLLSRDMYVPQFSHLEWVKVNIAKHPVLFLEAVAGFKCYNEIPGVEVSDELRAIYANTIFVHPKYLLQLQNDCDGDLARVTFDQYWLPLYSGAVMKSCASSFHANYISGEEDLGVDLSKLPKHVSFTHAELYTAIQQASEAKMNVALFTDNLHKVMAAYRSSPITERAVNKFGDKGYQMIKDAIIVVATMVQTDAMNAIKHDGGVTAGAALTSVSLIKEDGYNIAKEAMLSYIEQHDILCEDKKAFAALVCTLMLYVHSIDLNRDKAGLTNQYERLVFKNQPKEVFEYEDLDGNVVVGSRRLDFFGKFADSWNVTGTYSMFTEYVQRFYGRSA